MKKNNIIILIISIIILAFGAYSIFKKETNTTNVKNDSTVHYVCLEGTIDAAYNQSSVDLTLSDSRKLSLPQSISASGIRYENAGIVFVSKGDNAFLQENNVVTFNNCLASNIVSSTVTGQSIFTDQGKTLSFSYPNDLVVSGGDIGYTQDWRNNTQTLGITLAKILIPKDTQPKTNFAESKFNIGTSSDVNAIKNCLIPQNGELSSGVVTINGVLYTKLTLSDAGAGNFYETTSYRTLRNSQCYAIEYTIHYMNIGNYSPDQGIKEFDKQKVINTFEAIAHSVKFL